MKVYIDPTANYIKTENNFKIYVGSVTKDILYPEEGNIFINDEDDSIIGDSINVLYKFYDNFGNKLGLPIVEKEYDSYHEENYLERMIYEYTKL